MSSEATSDHSLNTLPILILSPHNRCNCRCVMCDIWRLRQVREITRRDLEGHLESLRKLGVEWIVFSGGEPLMHSDLWSLAGMCRAEGVRVTLLTAGLLLERHAHNVAESIDDVIVSLDGPPHVHDVVRGVAGAYRLLERGVGALRRWRADAPIHGRCTVQKYNARELRSTVRTASALNLNSISFLAADLSPETFNRRNAWTQERAAGVALSVAEADELEAEVEALIRDCQEEIGSGFVREKPDKLRRIVRSFRAHLGQTSPEAPRCNAPWVSAVVESDGTVRPCFFHGPIGNIHERPLAEVVNGAAGVEFRRRLDVAADPVCRRCVCSLFWERGNHEITKTAIVQDC